MKRKKKKESIGKEVVGEGREVRKERREGKKNREERKGSKKRKGTKEREEERKEIYGMNGKQKGKEMKLS